MKAMLLAVFGLLASAMTALAQSQCGDFAQVVKVLSTRYGEEQIGQGLAQQGAVFLFARPVGASWTIVLQAPGEPACMVAVGRNWEAQQPPPPGQEG
jgi:hypothetical protein